MVNFSLTPNQRFGNEVLNCKMAYSELFNYLHQIKAQKLDQLIGPQITNNSKLESLKTVVAIPVNFTLSDSEK